VVKNKVAPPFRKAELEIIFGKGISWSASLLDAAVKCNVIEKKGAWYTWGAEKIGQGRENAKAYLEQFTEEAKKIESQVREILFHPEKAGSAHHDQGTGNEAFFAVPDDELPSTGTASDTERIRTEDLF
jgi:recombination protein RecA